MKAEINEQWVGRVVVPDDIETLMDMMEAMRDESPVLKSVTVNRDRTKNMILALMQAGQFVGIISGVGCMLGIVGANWYSERIEAFEQMLYVKPKARGTRAADILLRMFEYECVRNRGAKSVHVGSSTGISDERTANFYRSRGFNDRGISLTRDYPDV